MTSDHIYQVAKVGCTRLKRLQTDYIDLYQIHWPDRYVPLFGDPDYDPQRERETVAIAEQLEVFANLIKAGKIGCDL
ncbi:MAG: aldo/keto reductase [Snowella sp.]